MRILSLDLGTHTGWAWNRGKDIKSGTENFRGSKKDERGLIYGLFYNWLDAMIFTNQIDMVAYEMPHNRGGAPTEMLNTFAGLVQMRCYAWQIPHKVVHSLTIKKFITGNGRANKTDVMKAVKKRYPKIKIIDDNQSDAIALLEYMMGEISG